ncbi:hypothetical protein EW146_g1991 [Bondarzewia mesenterica]|uniref:CHCH domain-containing protein n=1 Tax=Bondarzewia mesenterica TaxID=1095465 RepID=A0A4V3XFW7_9AGAM|nr:hypothetical protein EW146_g1991 [Bondarzewia mesenterica]
MARQSRSRPTTSRPAAARSSVPSRGAATAAYPTQHQAPSAPAPPAHTQTHAPPQTAAAPTKEPGMLSQMAATAGSVAIGSTIGHGISSMLFGGSSSAAPAAEQQQAPVNQMQQGSGISCEVQAKEFTKCLDQADLPSCTWYLEQLKACQAAAAPY